MPTKHRLNQLKSTKAIAVKVCKKRKFEANLVVNLQPEIEDDKLSIANISNIDIEFQTWFWNNCSNKSDSDIKEGEDGDENELDLEVEESRVVSLKVCKEIK